MERYNFFSAMQSSSSSSSSNSASKLPAMEPRVLRRLSAAAWIEGETSMPTSFAPPVAALSCGGPSFPLGASSLDDAAHAATKPARPSIIISPFLPPLSTNGSNVSVTTSSIRPTSPVLCLRFDRIVVPACPSTNAPHTAPGCVALPINELANMRTETGSYPPWDAVSPSPPLCPWPPPQFAVSLGYVSSTGSNRSRSDLVAEMDAPARSLARERSLTSANTASRIESAALADTGEYVTTVLSEECIELKEGADFLGATLHSGRGFAAHAASARDAATYGTACPPSNRPATVRTSGCCSLADFPPSSDSLYVTLHHRAMVRCNA
mmetsp:Transcript_23306/g.56250  ORF Transcript_23306/g.56250 Transcript_23306/m.56250 type:complete len:324 (+) Transcript_23306:1471-2442(+)